MNVKARGRRRTKEKSATLVSRLVRRLRVTLGFSTDPRSDAIRATTLAGLVAVTFALLGTSQHNRVADWLADAPFNPDTALRALSRGWFESHRTVPVTIVDIDDETHRGWGAPPITPRDQLVRLLHVVTQAAPSAVVVDIDLSGGEMPGASGDAGSLALHEYLARYAGPALIVLPKRVETAQDGTRRTTTSPFDAVIAKNPHLAWAHAGFETGGGGAVRSWQRWLPICSAGGLQWLPSVAMSLAASLAKPLPGLDHVMAPAAQNQSCRVAESPDGNAQRLLIGPRLTGEARATPRTDAQAVSATLLLDPEIARDDARLFRDRVVFIGATHPSSGDFWMTPSGVLPGVELLANTVRYTPLQAERHGWSANLAYHVVALLLFALFVFVAWWLRGFGAVILITTGVLTIVAVLLALFDSLLVFDALEAAILLSIAYKALETAGRSVEELNERRPRFPAGPAGWWRALGAGWRREHKSPGGQGE
ncbi:MAG: CHASE2 domain-containing protein [Steroidobacteraceae bacterium]|nr:CHASE2 domain-containing protein [Pseudomonadota bacterium]MBP6106895.1 CHASE2 domain-containing protein [Steroidobacteraceae bacterium]MBP7015167.1 CHASE2 domain-containing protein [Steroidobacteraceae bacterium]